LLPYLADDLAFVGATLAGLFTLAAAGFFFGAPSSSACELSPQRNTASETIQTEATTMPSAASHCHRKPDAAVAAPAAADSRSALAIVNRVNR
jgi:hypothetical protein